MAIRWYSLVVDCRDHAAQATWWAETLGWQVIHRGETEWVIVPGWVDAAVLAATPWEQVGPGITFVPVGGDKQIDNRLHLDLAPHLSDDRDAEVTRLLGRGASYADVGQAVDASHTVFRDPEGNEFCLLSARDS